MAGSSLDRLPERALVETIKGVRQAASEAKGSGVLVTGANLAYFVTETTDTFDWSGPLNGSVGSPAYGQARLQITLTAPRAEVPLADLAVVVYYSSNGGSTWEEYTFQRGMAESMTGTAPEILRDLKLLPGIVTKPREVKFALQLFGRLNSMVAIKLQAVSTDDVEISIVRVA